jgi:DNA gyrase subunit A
MVVADPEATLLTACANGYGKRTPFGVNLEDVPTGDDSQVAGDELDDESASGQRYRTQRRGGKGIRDIKTTARNGPVMGIVRVSDDDELIMVTARGKLQRVLAAEISVIGRNTQGVRIMRLDANDTLAAVVRVRRDINGSDDAAATDRGSPPEHPESHPPSPAAPADHGIHPHNEDSTE